LLDAEPPTVADIAAKLMKAGGLGRETAHHRAMMILAWRRRLGLHGKSRVDGSSSGWWRRIELRNFRSIESVTVDLAPLTLVVGPNGSGKSNFADALVFARDVALDASVAVESRGGILGVRRWRPTKPTDVTVDVRAARSRRDLEINYVRHSFTIHSGKKGDWSFSRETLQNVAKTEVVFHIDRTRDSYTGEGLNKVPIMPTASAMVTAHQLRGFARSAALRSVRRYRVSPDEMRKPQLSSDKTRLDENGAKYRRGRTESAGIEEGRS
jgi:type I restriction enzyme M protein